MELDVPSGYTRVRTSPNGLRGVFSGLLSGTCGRAPGSNCLSVSFSGSNPSGIIVGILGDKRNVSSSGLPCVFSHFFADRSCSGCSSNINLSCIGSLIRLRSKAVTTCSRRNGCARFDVYLPRERRGNKGIRSRGSRLERCSASVFPRPILGVRGSKPSISGRLCKRLTTRAAVLVISSSGSVERVLISCFSHDCRILRTCDNRVTTRVIRRGGISVIVDSIVLDKKVSNFRLYHCLGGSVRADRVEIVLAAILSRRSCGCRNCETNTSSCIIGPFDFSLLRLEIEGVVMNSFGLERVHGIDVSLSGVSVPSSGSSRRLLGGLISIVVKRLSSFSFKIGRLY